MFCNKEEILLHFINKNEEILSNKYYLQKLDIDRMKRFIDNGEFKISV